MVFQCSEKEFALLWEGISTSAFPPLPGVATYDWFWWYKSNRGCSIFVWLHGHIFVGYPPWHSFPRRVGSCYLDFKIKNIPFHYQCGSVGWALSHELKGCWFDSQSGHMPGLWTRSLVGGVREEVYQCFSHTLIFLSLSFFLLPPLSKSKYIKLFFKKKTSILCCIAFIWWYVYVLRMLDTRFNPNNYVWPQVRHLASTFF